MASSFSESSTTGAAVERGGEHTVPVQHLSTKSSHQGETGIRGERVERNMLLLLDKLYQSTAQFTTKSVGHASVAAHTDTQGEAF